MLAKILATSLPQLRFSSMHFGLKQGKYENFYRNNNFSFKSWFDILRRIKTKMKKEKNYGSKYREYEYDK